LQVLVQKQLVEIGGQVIGVFDVLARSGQPVVLVDPPQRPLDPRHHAAKAVIPRGARIVRRQPQKPHKVVALDGQMAVGIGLADRQFGAQHEGAEIGLRAEGDADPGLSRAMQAHRPIRPGDRKRACPDDPADQPAQKVLPHNGSDIRIRRNPSEVIR
jgi:hypothetical protein